ncbi:hypothetical protein J4Q44_G00020400 [Coregonus suidteri]|uniref:Histidine N-acetyltransferase C-terminal domain-containing protein n=1 Tax=Coregonus suidteri TaxID=861788 RepID=A0AAN8MLL6_9TELE
MSAVTFHRSLAGRLCRGDDSSSEKLSRYRLLAKEGILCLFCEVGEIGPFLEELQQRLEQEYKAEAFNPVTLSQAEEEKAVLSTNVVANLLPGGGQPGSASQEGADLGRDCPLRPNALSLCTIPYPVPYHHVALHFNNIFGHSLYSVCAVFLAQLRNLLSCLSGYLIFYTYVHPSIWPGLKQFCQNSSNVMFFKDYWEELLVETDL